MRFLQCCNCKSTGCRNYFQVAAALRVEARTVPCNIDDGFNGWCCYSELECDVPWTGATARATEVHKKVLLAIDWRDADLRHRASDGSSR